VIVVLCVVVFVGLMIRRRAVRARRLAGLDGSRPVFSVEPPTRRLGSRRGERL